jgi:hypothetical protein
MDTPVTRCRDSIFGRNGVYNAPFIALDIHGTRQAAADTDGDDFLDHLIVLSNNRRSRRAERNRDSGGQWRPVKNRVLHAQSPLACYLMNLPVIGVFSVTAPFLKGTKKMTALSVHVYTYL